MPYTKQQAMEKAKNAAIKLERNYHVVQEDDEYDFTGDNGLETWWLGAKVICTFTPDGECLTD